MGFDQLCFIYGALSTFAVGKIDHSRVFNYSFKTVDSTELATDLAETGGGSRLESWNYCFLPTIWKHVYTAVVYHKRIFQWNPVESIIPGGDVRM